MEETITQLGGNAGRLIRRKHSRKGFNEIVHQRSPTEQEFISEKKGKSLESKYGVKNVKKISGEHCDVNDKYGRTVEQKLKSGETICISPKIKFELMKLNKNRDIQNKQMVERYLQDNDLTEYLSPYFADPVQKNILSYILGKRNVDEMEMLNALVYSGIINQSCPAPGAPNKTEAYTNLVTGKMECREPIPNRQQTSGVDTCPRTINGVPVGDPFAVEKYINYFGEAECRRPVISGAFSCPPSNDPTKTKHITLKNNVGICVVDPATIPAKEKIMIPSNFTMSAVKRIAEILRNAKSLDDINMGLSGDPHYEAIMAIVSNMKSDEDISIAKTAMFEYAKNLPEFQTEQFSIDQMLDFNGIDISAFKPRR